MKRLLFFSLVLFFLISPVRATQSFSARGLVLGVDAPRHSLEISCDKIDGYMEAMVMSLPVHNPNEMGGLRAGAMIEFTLFVDDSSSYIGNIHIYRYQSVEQDPISARRLKLMADVAAGKPVEAEIKVGTHVSDFSLIDQNGQNVSLSQFSGRVVAITFTYTHCVLPNFCFRISNSFRNLQKRFSGVMGRDLVLMTITFDPLHDTPEAMAKYGKTWNANSNNWKLLTGSSEEIEKLCARFGISVWADEGLMTHSLRTLIVDRDGNLVANLEGNEYSAGQLGDLVQSVIARKPSRSVRETGK